MRTSNPAFNTPAFTQPQRWSDLAPAQAKTMTVSGTVNASFILLTLTAGAAVAGWMVAAGNPGLIYPASIGAFMVSLAIGFGLRLAPKYSPFIAPVYALVEGVFLGAISWAFQKYIAPGVVFQALILTFGIFFALLAAYSVGLIRIGSVAKRCIIAATGGVMFLYVAIFALRMLGIQNVPFLHDIMSVKGGGMIGIGFSLFVVVLASLNLVLDFQFVEEGAQNQLPKYMEWYGAFALLTTLIWLYIEILRLLAKLQRR